MGVRLYDQPYSSFYIHNMFTVGDRHRDVSGSLNQAATLAKQHSSTSSEWRGTATKLRVAYDQHQRVANAEPARPKKVKVLEKEMAKVTEI